jgi:hypothetical protein
MGAMEKERENPSGGMDEDTKRRCDVIQALWANAWKRIADRRSTEWRVSFSLWTALVGVLVVSLSHNKNPGLLAGLPECAIALVAFGILVVHAWCLWGMLKRHWVDRDMAVEYERVLRHLVSINLPRRAETDLENILGHSRQFPCGLGWWVTCQLLVTALLCAAVALALA